MTRRSWFVAIAVCLALSACSSSTERGGEPLTTAASSTLTSEVQDVPGRCNQYPEVCGPDALDGEIPSDPVRAAEVVAPALLGQSERVIEELATTGVPIRVVSRGDQELPGVTDRTTPGLVNVRVGEFDVGGEVQFRIHQAEVNAPTGLRYFRWSPAGGLPPQIGG